MIAIVDYGLGNIQAFLNIYKRLNISAMAVSSSDQLDESEKIILPGVGAFDWAMTCLKASGLRPKLDELVLNRKIPILGVCVGMQMMAKRSAEGSSAGLGWIDAEVRKLKPIGEEQGLKLPHMGWNDVSPVNHLDLFRGISNPRFYFLHSYYLVAKNSQDALASSEYGTQFSCSIRAGNVFGTQFHPEKSHKWGIQLLKNFAEL